MTAFEFNLGCRFALTLHISLCIIKYMHHVQKLIQLLSITLRQKRYWLNKRLPHFGYSETLTPISLTVRGKEQVASALIYTAAQQTL